MMAALISTDTKSLMEQHLVALRAYARRLLLIGEALTTQEEDDKSNRLREFMTIGTSLKLTQNELVALLYRGLFDTKRGCGCPRCQARQ